MRRRRRSSAAGSHCDSSSSSPPSSHELLPRSSLPRVFWISRSSQQFLWQLRAAVSNAFPNLYLYKYIAGTDTSYVPTGLHLTDLFPLILYFLLPIRDWLEGITLTITRWICYEKDSCCYLVYDSDARAYCWQIIIKRGLPLFILCHLLGLDCVYWLKEQQGQCF